MALAIDICWCSITIILGSSSADTGVLPGLGGVGGYLSATSDSMPSVGGPGLSANAKGRCRPVGAMRLMATAACEGKEAPQKVKVSALLGRALNSMMSRFERWCQ